MIKPFLKWVGGKRSILPELVSRLPTNFSSYSEPFIGGGSLFFAIQPTNATICDSNWDLINTYLIVKNRPNDLINFLKEYQNKHSKEFYYITRSLFNEHKLNQIERTAAFIYLNKTCFNGLYRVNKSGLFNVPMGSYTDPKILDESNLLACSSALKNTNIIHCDFTFIKPIPNGFYYFDPPYHQTYTQYSSTGFDESRQIELAGLCIKIDHMGGFFMASNSDTSFIRSIYSKFKIQNVSALRSVSRTGNDRGRVNEVIITNY